MPRSGSYEYWLVLVVMYNFLAFALPAIIGAIADFLDLEDSLAAAGCFILSAAALFHNNILFLVLLLGIGNGFFHVGAGRNVLMKSEGRYTPSGIFICSGAFGVFLGTKSGQPFVNILPNILAVLLCFIGIVLLVGYIKRDDRKNKKSVLSSEAYINKESEKRVYALPVIMILIVVIIRSFYGTAVSYSWNSFFEIGLVFTICIALGKALGGIIADKAGIGAAAVISLGGAAVTVLFSENSMVLGCISILLFNMTMPITLGLIASAWKRFPGFAFGVLMLALFIGTLPDIYGGGIALTTVQLSITAAISLICLLIAVLTLKKEKMTQC